jgi:uncharacterized repeat protein (TIGR01451 family)
MMRINKHLIKAGIITCLSALAVSGTAQMQRKEGSNWIFGYNAGMTWNTTQTISGMSGLPTPLTGSQMKTREGSFCMSDANGKLLFYSDGITVWNGNHAVMPNGTGLSGSNDAAQSGIIIPYPGQAGKYIAFTIGQYNSTYSTLKYSVIDMTLDGGLGDVVAAQKNIPLTGHSGMSGENVVTVKKADGSGYWLVSAGRYTTSSPTFHINVWEVTGAGVNTACLASYPLPNTTTLDRGTEGYFRFSADGRHFAYPTFDEKQIFFGEFDPATGTFPTIKAMSAYKCYGLDFNPDGDLLYAMEINPYTVHCYKFADLLASSNPGAMPHYTIPTSVTALPLQLGPDGRMYSTINSSPDMLVIDNINDYGKATAHVVSGLIGKNATGQLGLPSFSADFITLNDAPVTTDDTVTVFLNGNTVCVPVTRNDYDLNSKHSLSLVNVFYDDAADAAKTEFTFTPGDSAVCITAKAAAREGDEIILLYTVCDNANPAPLCADGKIIVRIAKYPDNISDADCYVDPPAMVWNIGSNPTLLGPTTGTVNRVSVYQTPYVGDLDGDGNVEIVVAKKHTGGNFTPWAYYTDGIYIFDRGNNSFRSITGVPRFSTAGRGQIGLARPNAASQGIIVLAAMDGYLYAYNKNSTSQIWKSDNAYTTYDVPNTGAANTKGFKAASIMFSDFDGDGNAEIVTGDRIFDLATGKLLLDCGFLSKQSLQLPKVSVVDVNGDGKPELVWGGNSYSIQITGRTGTGGNSYSLMYSVTDATALTGLPNSNVMLTAPIDIDLDGNVDILAYGTDYFYIYNPSTGDIKVRQAISADDSGLGTPFIGDIDGDKYPELIYGEAQKNNCIVAWDIDAGGLQTQSASVKWRLPTTDGSRETGLTLFDFNQDGTFEIVYRDETQLRIFNGYDQTTINTPLASQTCISSTQGEYPVIADVDNDGEAEIIVTGTPSGDNTYGYIFIFDAGSGTRWAPARKVWNQYAYNAVNINEDLTVPRYPLNPATVFPGKDGNVYTAGDNVRPYNAFLQQQTLLSKNGVPLWITPNAVADEDLTATALSGNTLKMTVGIINRGNAILGSPLYVTFYRDSISTASRIETVNSAIQILPGDTGYVTLTIPDVTAARPFTKIIARTNDNGTTFPFQMECDTTDSDISLLNPVINLYMRKYATLNGVQDNGAYPNPVSVLYNENIEYKIAVINTNPKKGDVIITDTLPPYLDYVAGSGTKSLSHDYTKTAPKRKVLTWTLHDLSPLAKDTVRYEATPESGAVASQPFFINYAWVGIERSVGDTIFIRTNSIYHQGAGISVVTFSATAGGRLYNTEPQALDYRTSLRTGALALADDGYEFAGWSHDEYISLKGEKINAASGIMHCGDIVIYGNVELRADFVPAGQKPVDNEIVEKPLEETGDNVWANGRDLYIRTKKGTAARICTLDGILHQQFTVTEDGTTTVRLNRGVYIVTLNGGAGYKVRVES